MTRKHYNIEQLDLSHSFSDEMNKDNKFMKHGTVQQTFLDGVDVINKNDLTEVSKDDEKARKKSSEKDFKSFLEVCQ